MTVQKAQIESLIQEIDEILSKTAPRLPWIMPNEAVHQRQVLEQTRRYLMSLQAEQPIASLAPEDVAATPSPEKVVELPRLGETDSEHSDPGSADAVSFDLSKGRSEAAIETEIPAAAKIDRPAQFLSPASVPVPTSTPAQTVQTEAVESAQQALQAVVQEMNYLRSNLLQPMRSDLDVLRQQREMLVQEIRQLEAQRQQYALPQQNQLLMEFLQAAFRQMQDNLSAQVTQMIATLPAQPPSPALPEGAPNLSGSDLMAMSPAQRLEQIQRVQTQSDQLLLKLDSSLRIIFNSLQQNVQTYQDSLEQGLSRMHNLGQQGEAMFSALVTRLAEQLGREASTFLQSSIEPAPWEPALPPKEGAAKPPESASKPSSAQVNQSEGNIAQLLDELNELDAAQPAPIQDAFAGDAFVTPDQFVTPGQSVDADALNSLDLLDLELKQLDLDSVSPEPFAIVDEDSTLFQDEPMNAFLTTDLTVLQDDSEPEVLQSFASGEAGVSSFPQDEPSEVLDLLNQISVQPPIEEADRPSDEMSQFSETGELSPEAAAENSQTAELPLVVSPDSLYEDEFYQSLFGEANAQSVVPQGSEAGMIAEDLFADVELAESGEESAIVDSATPAANLTEAPEIATAEENWFSRFPDAEAAAQSYPDAASAEELTIVEAPELPQTFENVLLPTADLQSQWAIESSSPSLMPDEVSAEEAAIDFPVQEESAQVELAPEESTQKSSKEKEEAIETIGSLLDLVPFESLSENSAPNLAQSSLAQSQTALDEQTFELAQPGEDLLADEPAHPEVLLNLKLPSATLEQLAQDLSTLEGGDADLTLADAADWMLPNDSSESFADSGAEPIEGLSLDYPDLPADLSVSSNDGSADVSGNLFSTNSDWVDLPAEASTLSGAEESGDKPEQESIGWNVFGSVPSDSVSANGVPDQSTSEAAPENPAAVPVESDASENDFLNNTAFTLEGLESLFENLPPIASPYRDDSAEPSPEPSSEPSSEAIELEDAEKKKS